MFNRSNQMLLLIAGTLLALSSSSLAITSRTYRPSSSYRTCQKVSWVFDQISQNVSNNELTNSFVKFCEHDESGANKETCQYIADYLLPTYNEIRKDDFCVNLHMNKHAHNEKDKPNCATCIEFIGEIKLLLSQPDTQKLVKEKLISFCTNLPSFDTECKSFVDNEFNKVVQWINTFEPAHFCTLIHQCGNGESQKVAVPAASLLNLREPAKPKPRKTQQLTIRPTYSGSLGLPTTLRCEVCDEVMKWTLKILADNRTEIAIAHAFDSVCASFYKHNSLKQAHCTHLVDQYTVQLINFIAEDVKPDSICHLLDFCPSSSAMQITFSHYLPSESTKPVTGLTATNRKPKGPSCLLCIELFRYVYKRVNANHTETEIEKTMDEACNFLYKISHSENKLKSCESFVAANTKLMVKLIKSNAGPTLTCFAVGACATPANVKLHMQLTEPAKQKQTLIAPKQSQFSSICQKMMNVRLYQHIKSAKNNGETLVHLRRACEQQATEQDKSDCNVYVYKQQLALQKAFAQARSHHEVCSLTQNPAPVSTSVSTSNENSGSCDMCKFVVGIFYKDLKQNKTEAEIVTFLTKVCERFSPDSQKSECKAKVTAYVQELINIIENSTNPGEACALLGYCGKKSSVSSSSLIAELTNFLTKASIPKFGSIRQVALKDKTVNAGPSPVCQQCINFVTPVHNWLSNKTCENDLLNDVAQLCSKCPAVDQCNQVLQSHIKAYFDAVDKYSDPSLVCHHIGFCSQARSTSRINNRLVLNRIQPKTHVETALKPHSIKSEICYECQLLTQFVQSLLLNSSIQTTLISEVKTVLCNPIPHLIERKVCDDFFDKDGPLIIQHLANTVFDSKRVCQQQLHVCPNSSQSHFQSLSAPQQTRHRRQTSVGSDKCSWGPSYWCRNKETAKECNVTEYCVDKFWKKDD